MTGLFRRFRRDRSGATAIEFAFVFPPFLMLLFGTIAISLYFLSDVMLNRALVSSVRQIRTGQSVSGTELKVSELKAQICAASAGLIECSKLRLHITSPSPSWTGFQPTKCATDGTMTPSTLLEASNVSSATGRSDKYVFISACYPWDVAVNLPYIKLGNLNNGTARLIQAVVAFKTEMFE